MCIGIPMRLVEDGSVAALCEDAGGRRQQVDLLLVGDQPAGTWVLVHIDSAVRVLDAAEAGLIGDALSGLAAALDGRPIDDYFRDLIDREPQLPDFLRPAAAGEG